MSYRADKLGVDTPTDTRTDRCKQWQYLTFTLLPCWIFWYHCTTAMLGAQPLLPGVRESPGTSTLNDLRWAVARGVMSSKELLSALLCAVYPGIWGSSGINWRYLSSLLLKQSTLRLVILRISGGRVLNSCCPWMGRLAYCSFWMDAGAACLTAGTMHSRPRRGCHFAMIFGVWSFVLSTFGTCPSRNAPDINNSISFSASLQGIEVQCA